MPSRHIIVRFVMIALVIGILLGPTLYEIAKDSSAYVAKSGMVVDAGTGAGLGGVNVIAVGTVSMQTLMGSGSSAVLYRHVTKTDEKGLYSIPSMWTSAATRFIPFPASTRPRVSWVVTAFKFGYVIAGDESVMPSETTGAPLPKPASTTKSPTYARHLFSSEIEPIKMKAFNLSDRDKSIYYGEILTVGRSLTERYANQPIEVEMRRQVYEALAPKICALPPDTYMDWTITDFVKMPQKFLREISRRERSAFDRALATGSAPQIRARSECEAINSEAGGPP